MTTIFSSSSSILQRTVAANHVNYAVNYALRRQLSTQSFAELYRKSVDNAALKTGDIVQGHIVGAFRPRSTTSRFYIVDFGMKSEAPFTPRELPGLSKVGDGVSMPLISVEDDFNEPVFDQDRVSELPAIQAERYSLLVRKPSPEPRFFYGRFSRFNRGGATAKVLGLDAFVPRHHVLVLERPILGSFSPFYLLSMQGDIPSKRNTSLDLYPVVSSYGGVMFCLANLVGFDSAWEKSGGGHQRDRLAYLQLLTKILTQKNAAVRRMLPRSAPARGGEGYHRIDRRARRADESIGDTAWLNELPRGNWSSSTVSTRRPQNPIPENVKISNQSPTFDRAMGGARSRHSRNKKTERWDKKGFGDDDAL